MPITNDRRGVLGNVLFSFALLGSVLALIVLGNVARYYSSQSLILLCMTTLLRTIFLVYSLNWAIPKRIRRLTSLALTLTGLVAFNYSFPLVCQSLQFFILELFLDQWARSEEEGSFVSDYFLDGYNDQPGGSTWMLSLKVTLSFFLFFEGFTFGLLFPFHSTVSSYTTPFYPCCDGYETLESSPRPLPDGVSLHFNHHSTSSGRFPVDLERELEQKVSRLEYIVTAPSSPPAPPPSNIDVIKAYPV